MLPLSYISSFCRWKAIGFVLLVVLISEQNELNSLQSGDDMLLFVFNSFNPICTTSELAFNPLEDSSVLLLITNTITKHMFETSNHLFI